jgi:hypothetical protein
VSFAYFDGGATSARVVSTARLELGLAPAKSFVARARLAEAP